jgi:hypothetical protein
MANQPSSPPVDAFAKAYFHDQDTIQTSGVNDSDGSRRLPLNVLDFQFALMRGQLVQQLLGKCCRDGKQCTKR